MFAASPWTQQVGAGQLLCLVMIGVTIHLNPYLDSGLETHLLYVDKKHRILRKLAQAGSLHRDAQCMSDGHNCTNSPHRYAFSKG